MIYNLKIGEVILIGDNTILLDYGYRFIRSLHALDSRLQTQVSSHYNFIG